MATARQQPHHRAVAAERPSVVSLSSCLTCSLCQGYLIDAVTVVKCLHSFCKSCILKRIEKESSCPVCDLRISTMKLDLHLKKDDVLQNIVYKAVPGLYQREMKRRRDFYSSRSKGDKTTLTPEELGEMDDSSKGRIIFSPDEAISLSLEYKHLNDEMFKSDKPKLEKHDPPFKELPKRYLNCPAAVTIALLQKFLRTKYSIGSKCRVDIYYMNDVLWSKYTLMDIAYIYSWRRDTPLELSFWIWDPSAKQLGAPFTGANVGGNLGPSRLHTAPSTDACEQTKTSSYLSNSVVDTERGRQHAKDDNTPSDAAVPSKLAFTDASTSKPAEVQPAGKHLDEVQKSSTKSEVASRVSSTGTATPVPRTPVTAQCKAVPVICHKAKEGCPVPPSCDKKGSPTKDATTEKHNFDFAPKQAVISQKVSLLEDDNFGCARTSGSYSWKANIAKIVSTLEKCDEIDDERASPDRPEVATAVASAATTAAATPPVMQKVKDTAPAAAEKVSTSAATETKATPSCVAIINGVGSDTFKSWRSLSIERPTVDDPKQATSVMEKSKETANTKPEAPPVKTCVSRAADMAEAKLNAMRAAALTALNKSKSEAALKETRPTESSPVVSTTSVVNVQNDATQRLSKPSEVSSTAKEPAEAAASPEKTSPETAEPVTTTTMTVASTLPTYLTLSRSHPSLFHGTQQKRRGRPKLATVNSLNEEIERAHLLASQAALEIQSKPAIPVITSLRIKPILPPLDKAEQKSPKPAGTPPKETDLTHHSDKSDSDEGRRKSKRRKTGNESSSSHQKEVSVTSDSPLGSPRNSGTPEKITLRVTRDETCTLKVEKLQRAPTTMTVSTDGLHDSGFCEDVAVERSPSSSDSKAKEDKVDKKVSHNSKQVHDITKKVSEVVSSARKDVVGKNEKAKEKTVAALKVAQLKEHKEKTLAASKTSEQRKESRKGKRRSVEDWVKDQNKWIDVSKVKCSDGQLGTAPHADQAPKTDTSEDPTQKGTTQRRGRKRSNPVKIEKLEVPAEAQQRTKSPPAPTVAQGAPASKASDVHTSKEKSSPPNTPKKAVTELIIPKYIPNPATSIPLTVAHARNKRLKETPKLTSQSLATSWNCTTSKSAVEQQRGDSEKSKFFKEVLNLSMKETTKVPQPPCPSIAKKADDASTPPPPQKTKKMSSSQILKVVEKIAASQKAGGKNESKKVSTSTEHRCSGPQVESAKVNSAVDERRRSPSKERSRSRLMGKTLVARPASRSRLEKSWRRSPPSPAGAVGKPEATVVANPLNAPHDGAEMEILPKLNQAGVFRLEFPGTEQQNSDPHFDRMSPSPCKAAEDESSSKSIMLENREDVAESIKNIARIRKTILESQQRSMSKDCSNAVLENGLHETSGAITTNDTSCVASPVVSKQTSQSNSGKTRAATETRAPRQSGDACMGPIVQKQNAHTEPSKSPLTNERREAPASKSARSSPVNNTVPSNGPSTVIHIQKFITASGKQKFTVLSPNDCRPPFAAEVSDQASRSPSPSKRCSARPASDAAAAPARSSPGTPRSARESLTSPDTSSCGAAPCRALDVSPRKEHTIETPVHFQRRSPGIKKDITSCVQSTLVHPSHASAMSVPVKIENLVQHSAHMDHGYSKQDPLLQQEQMKSERHSISSSSNETCAETSNGDLPNARASEHMYRTTVAEIDLFTALSIIETIKGRATVHDIIEDYVAHLGKFFSMLESSDDQTQRLIEEAFQSKRAVLLRLVRLLKKLTADLSSNQVSQVLALEVLIERFLYRYGQDTIVDDLTLDQRVEEVTTSDHFVCCETPVLVEPVYGPEDLEEPTFSFAAPSCEVVVTTPSGVQCTGKRGRVSKAKRSTAWKRRVAQVLKLREPLWLLPVVPGLCSALKVSVAPFGPMVSQEMFESASRREPIARLPHAQSDIKSLLPVSSAALRSLPEGCLQLTCRFGSSLCSLGRSFLHLVNSNRNGRRTFFLPTPDVDEQTSPRGTNAGSLLPRQLYHPTSSQFERTMLAAICKLLRGDGVCDGSGALAMPPGRICMATVESTLVITSPNTKNKLMLSAEVGGRLLRGLLSGLGSLPANDCRLDLESLFAILAGKMSSASCGSSVPSVTDAPRCLSAVQDGAGGGTLSCASVAGGSVVQTVHRNSVHSSCVKGNGQDYIQTSAATVARTQAGASGRDSLSKRSLPSNVFKTVKAIRSEQDVVAPVLSAAAPSSCAKRMRISAPGRSGAAADNIRRALSFRVSRKVTAARAGGIRFGRKARSLSASTGALQTKPVPAASCGGTTNAPATMDSVTSPSQATPLKRPAQGPTIPVLTPAKRQLNSSHIPAGKGRLARLLQPPPCVVPRDRLVLLHCLEPAEQRRRAAGRAKPKPKPVTSR